MANTLNQLKKMRAAQMTRGSNALQGLAYGIPVNAKEIAAVTGPAAVAVVAIELLSPLPTTVLAVVAEAGIALAAAMGIKSAIQGREFWKAAIMGTTMDKVVKEIKKAEEYPEGALDSNLKPTRSRVTPWCVPEDMKDAFLREHGASIIRD